VKHTLAIATLLVSAFPALAVDQNKLDANPSLFSVMAALQAAGYKTADTPFAEIVRTHLAAHKIEVKSELENFFASHRRKDSGADLAQYVSFAFSVSEPPEFAMKFKPGEIPPDVEGLEGFTRLMVRFHREAEIDQLWEKAQPYFEAEFRRYQAPVMGALLEANGYLRNPTSGYMGRTFQVIMDILGPSNQVQTRSYRDDYYIVVTPAAEIRTADIRHAYFHYLLDPLFIKYSEVVNKKKSLVDFALGAPVLDESFKSDFLLLSTECLIKAIESRLTKGDEKRKELVKQDLAEGYILTPYFATALIAYEKQEAGMRVYLPDMIAAIDLKKESDRLDRVQFTSTRPERSAPAIRRPEAAPLDPAEQTLEAAEKLYGARQLDKAAETYRKVLEQTSNQSLHARSYYGLARIAVLQKDPELGEKLFHKTLELSPDAQTHGWAEVYLGRLADVTGDREQATQHYQSALAVEGVSPGARQAAEQGLKKQK
jgi:tetratricopeptide (TPR) repeat protein